LDFFFIPIQYRTIHSNYLTGTLPPFQNASNIPYLSLASNFLIGGGLPAAPNTEIDLRFNYLTNCSSLCCLVNADCYTECVSAPDLANYTLPSGVESSVWTELDVSFLGSNKRIIQVETHFSSPPHLLSSYGCPLTDGVSSCDPSFEWDNSSYYNPFGAIEVMEGVPYSHSQIANTLQMFVYYIRGEVCETAIKVSGQAVEATL
jgi:hypothetical protein